MPRTGLRATIIAAMGLMDGPASAHDMLVADFFYAAAMGPVANVAEILEHEPDLAIITPTRGFTAIHVVDDLGFAEKLALLQAHDADINARNYEGRTMLYMIIDPRLIPVAVAASADVNLRDNKGRAPLMLHLLNPDGGDFVPTLLAAGANLNAHNGNGVSLLEYAMEFDDPAVVQLLTNAGAT